MKKLHSKVAQNRPNFFFSIADRPRTSPNLNFCSMKIAHRETYDFGMQMWSPWSICQILKKFSPFLARLETVLEFRAEEAWN